MNTKNEKGNFLRVCDIEEFNSSSSAADSTEEAGVCNLLSIPNDLQRSAPNLSAGRHVNSPIAGMDSADSPATLRPTRSFNSHLRSGSGNKDPFIKSKLSGIDAKQIQIYLARQNSRGSLSSVSLVGTPVQSRPLSAESTPGAGANVVEPVRVTEPINLPSSPQRNVRPMSRAILPEDSQRFARRSPSLPIIDRPNDFWQEWVTNVQNFIYIGGVEAAYNENLLCKLNIEYILDLSNKQPHEIPRDKRSECPCVCPRETPHSRYRMSVPLDEHPTAADMTGYC